MKYPYQSKIRDCQSCFAVDRPAANRVSILNGIDQGKEMPSNWIYLSSKLA